MTRKQRHLLTRIIVAAVLFLAGSLLHLPELAEMAVFLICYVVVGWDIVWKAITNILHGQVFDENFLMTIATIGALIWANIPRVSPLCCFTRWANGSSPMRCPSPENLSQA